MKVIALIAILSLVTISNCADAKCDTFKCASGVTVPDGSCLKKVTTDGKKVGHIALQCKAPQVCPVEKIPTDDEVKCAEPAKPAALKDRVDGEACSADVKCVDGIECTNSKCVGKAKDADCTGLGQCAVGLYCNLTSKKCTAQIADEKTECLMDFDCANNLTCVGKKCLAYGSQENGTEVPSQLSCKSNETTRDGTKTVCSTTTLQGSNWKCSDAGQTQCKYTVKTSTETKDVAMDCVCSLSNATVQYCPGDNSKNSNKATAVTGVHTLRRFSADTKITVPWPYLEEADSCVKSLLNASFIKSAFAVLAALVVLL